MFEQADGFDDHHEVRCFFRGDVGLAAIIAVHRYVGGLAGGGTRMFPYGSFPDAVADALKLSRAMSYKYALAGIRCGGGKAVIIGNARSLKNPSLLRAFGESVDTFAGTYFAAPDVGISGTDVKIIGQATTHIKGIPEHEGDSSFATALGVHHAMRSALRARFGTDKFTGLRVAIQGVGGVGAHLAQRLAADGAFLIVADVDQQKVNRVAAETGATVAAIDDILTSHVDILAPCAMGAVISETIASSLRARIVCGGANNQLANDSAGQRLAERDILFVPDFVANAGGVIVGMQDPTAVDVRTKFARLAHIEATCAEIFGRCVESGQRPEVVAIEMAKTRLAAQLDAVAA